jgi:hypothetical protein
VTDLKKKIMRITASLSRPIAVERTDIFVCMILRDVDGQSADPGGRAF